jgi:hypothetical protein
VNPSARTSVTTTDPDPATEAVSATIPLPSRLDQISLEQALLDFEVANARVVDLTKRLVEATDELVRLRHETELLRPEVEAARGSRAYILAREMRRVIRLVRK